MKPTLLVLAAGMGSRYGALKQMDGVGPNNEAILDYSIFDAKRAGFGKVVFVIREDFAEAFKKVNNAEKFGLPVEYVYQSLDKLPDGFSVPEGRVKPWGTCHAVLMAKDVINEPFAAINADDYYGPHAFQAAYDSLKSLEDDPDRAHFFMVAYDLQNTLTENGFVSRGVCEVSESGTLKTIHERTHIISTCDGPLYTEDGETYHRLPADAPVSMNLWGFTPSLLTFLEERFPAFLDKILAENPLKGEFFLPFVVNELLEEGKANVRVLRSQDRWQGVTYREDRPQVQSALSQFAAQGLYPRPLWPSMS